MLVTKENFEGVLSTLSLTNERAIDSETFGVRYDDRLFSLIISTEKLNYYFNFLDYGGTIPVLPYECFKILQEKLFADPKVLWFIHNAKFDMRRLQIEGCSLAGDVWDTMCMERFVRNNYMEYSLAACLERRGWKKDDKVERYIEEHPKECITMVKIPGKAKKEKLKHYDKVPFDLMFEYGLTDGRETYKLGKHQQEYFAKNPDLLPLVENEKKLVKAVFNIESRGISVDLDQCQRAMDQDQKRLSEAYKELEAMAGIPYKSGPKWLTKICQEQGIEYALKDSGNPTFDKKALKAMNNPLTNLILEIRGYEKKITSFYSTFLHLAGEDGVIHPNLNIAGADTGRFTASEPNLQQVPKNKEEESESDTALRSIFKPRPDHILVMLDYDTMEYRLAADYSGEMEMIAAIKGGLDPHTFVANMMNVERTPAKTLNFQNLYGGGVAKLCETLFKPITKGDTLKLICRRYLWKSKKLTPKEIAKLQALPQTTIQNDVTELEKAEALQKKYFATLPKLDKLFENAEKTAVARGYIFNRYRRRIYLDNKKFAYKLVNYLIQGTGADIVKHAMVKIDAFLADKKSAVVLQIHDELLVEVHKSELHLVPAIKEIMENEYQPINGMNLTCGVDWSSKSWAEKIEGFPHEAENLSEAI